MTPDLPLTRDIVLIGGGHAHALLLRAWGMDPLPGARLTLINPTATAPYTGMLPGHVAGHYSRDALEIDLVRLARFAGARMIFGHVTGIDRAAKTLEVPGRPPVAYDYASLDIGISSNMPDLPGFTDHAIAAKPLGPFANRWLAHLEGDGGPVVIIGGGVAGVELSLAMQHALGGRGKVTVVEAGNALQGISASAADRLREEMGKAGISLLESTQATRIESGAVVLANGDVLEAALTVGAAGARPHDWLKETGLTLENGYVAVGADLKSVNDPNIFAVGDCAHLTASPRPKAGVYAVRAAPVLTGNLIAAAAGRPLKPFKPQEDFLRLISLGDKRAIADRNGRAIAGGWAWRWKDWIDRRFMDRLNHPPAMQFPAPPALRAEGTVSNQFLCAGCGSKIGSDVLDRVLRKLPSHMRDDVLTGPGDDAAVLQFGGATQVLTTDHLRAFWADPWLFGRIAAIHALGDIWAMGAAPQSAMAQITLPRLAPDLQHRWLTEIMAAATAVFAEERVQIVGGHSTQGAELTLGFTVTGLVDGRLLTLDGAKPGDRLILTRPLGSGTILAAEMAGKACGDDVEHALSTMATMQGNAARLLAPHASAMTDVTGFGLAGHSARLANASGLTAEINLDVVPLLSGAEALAQAGIRSTIWQANRDSVPFDGPDTDRAALLFDPQTAGGFLAAVPQTQAYRLRADLRDMGHTAEVIGEMTERHETAVFAR